MGKDNLQPIPSLVIHKLSQAQYDREKEAGRLDPNAIYLTPNGYTLPTASADTLGGIKVGENLTISDGVLSAKAGGVGKNVTGTEYTIGSSTVIAKDGAEIFNDYTNNKASGKHSHAEGWNTIANSSASHAEGFSTKASGEDSHAEGDNTIASGEGSHAEGSNTIASGDYSHAEGYSTKASGNYSHAEGNAQAAGSFSHAEGTATANGSCSHAEGSSTASGDYSSSHGRKTIAKGYAQAVFGKHNTLYDGATGENDATGSIFIVGVGTGTSARANALRITNAGAVMGSQSFTASGADYAEYYEWEDGNPNNEDRRGHFVTFADGNKIRIANAEDDYILGVVSVNPAVIGNGYTDNWQGMYLTNEYGMRLTEVVEVEEYLDEETNEVIPAHTETRFVINPDYDPNEKYLGRNERKEWSAIGTHGQLVVIDDGTCEVNHYCAVAENGTAAKADSKTEYRVIERINDTHIRIVIK